MSDISKITTPDGTIYNIKDAAARTALGGHTVGANVPAAAVFSDTTYTISIVNNILTLTSSTGDVTTITLPQSSPEVFIGSTTPTGYSVWIDPDGMLVDGNEVGY